MDLIPWSISIWSLTKRNDARMVMATSALFSLQVRVDALAFDALASTAGDFVLAFQLLQLDIVLFESSSFEATHDGTLGLASDQSIGQSCLFETDAEALARSLEGDEYASFVWLLLQRESQRARLVAFACVGLAPPHVAVDSARSARVSEWASVEASWPLVDHANKEVGSLRGSVTLACLGRSLAPHLEAQRFGGGLQLLTRPSERIEGSSRSQEIFPPEEKETTGDAQVNTALEGAVCVPEAVVTPSPVKKVSASPKTTPKAEEQRDASVQCDGDDEEAGQTKNLKPILIRGGDTGRGSPRRRLVDELDRIKIGETASPRLRSKREDTRRPRQALRTSYEERHARRRDVVEPFLESEQPPPLYFHKPKSTHATHHSTRNR